MASKIMEKLPKFERTYRYWYVCSGIGWLFAAIGLACLCVSFLTDHWLHYEVARDDVELVDPSAFGYTNEQYNKMFVEDSRFYSRERGMFRTCYTGNDTFFFKEAKDEDKDDNCLREIGYDFDNEDEFRSPNYEDDDFKLRRNLMRCHLAFFAIGIAGLGFTVVLALIGCFCLWYPVFIVVFIFCFLAAIFLLLAMVFFHYYKYIEENNLDFDTYGRKAWHQEKYLAENTVVNYEYSYFLGWVAFACAFIAFVIFAFAAWGIKKRKIEYVHMKPSKPKPKPQPQIVPVMAPPQPVMVPVPAPQPEPIYVQVPKPVYYPLENTYDTFDPTYAPLGGNPYDPYDPFARY